MKKVIILGTTGSIGSNSLSIIRENKDDFTVSALSAHTREENLLKAGEEFNVKNLALTGVKPLSERITFNGQTGLLRMIRETEADIVINGIAGSAGLLPSVAALESGKHLALANKETIVMAGKLIKELAGNRNLMILPVDSEHSAVFQLLRNRKPEEIAEIILTASGGPFWRKPLNQFKNITLKDTLKHPTWTMGRKISIDSATMANKGLEVIEASELFEMNRQDIKVLIHPESRVHSLIRTINREMYAQISNPDMRIPIQNALTYPEIKYSSFGYLDLANSSLSFYKPDRNRFPLLSFAYNALEYKASYPLAYNAANETAVDAFINGKIGFTMIHRMVEDTLQFDWTAIPKNFGSVMEIDKKVREKAANILKRLTP